jgi:hypothetical protein
MMRDRTTKVLSAALLAIGTLLVAVAPGVAAASSSRSSARASAVLGRGRPGALAGSKDAGGIAGQIEYGNGLGSSICVTVFQIPSRSSTNGAVFSGRTSVTPAGRFVLSGLAPGSYGVHFGPCRAESGFGTRDTFDSLDSSIGEWYGGAARGDGYAGAATLSASVRVPVLGRTVTPLRPLILADVDYTAGLSGVARLAAMIGRPVATGAAVVRVAGASAGRISGTVTDAAGKPLAGICVAAFPANGGFATPVATAADGTYTDSGLVPGKLAVGFAPGCGNSGNYLMQWYGGGEFPPGTLVKVVAGQTTTGINAALQHGGGLRGTVTSAGAKVSGVCISASTQTSDSSSSFESAVVNGRFAFGSLSPGSYKVDFGGTCASRVNGSYAPQWYNNEPSEATAAVVHVAAGPDTVISAVLAAGGEITGTVVSSSGTPVGGICVTTSSRLANLYGWDAFAVTSRSGTFVLPGLAAGSYSLDFGPGCGSKGSWVAGVSPSTIAVGAGQTISGITLTIARGGTFSGVVTDAAGPVADVCVLVAASESEELEPTVTAQDGSYEMSNVAPGRVLVEFVPACDEGGPVPNLVPQWYDGQSTAQAANPVTVTAGKDTSGIDAVLQPGGTLSGVVTDTSGNPIAGVCPLAFANSGGGGLGGFVIVGPENEVTNRDGQYSLVALPTGTYTVEFEPGCESPKASRFVSEEYGALGSFSGSSVVVSVVAGSTTAGIDASLPLAGSISGTVLQALGGTPTFLCVLIGTPGGRFLGETFGPPGPNGEYLLTGLHRPSTRSVSRPVATVSTRRSGTRDRLRSAMPQLSPSPRKRR